MPDDKEIMSWLDKAAGVKPDGPPLGLDDDKIIALAEKGADYKKPAEWSDLAGLARRIGVAPPTHEEASQRVKTKRFENIGIANVGMVNLAPEEYAKIDGANEGISEYDLAVVDGPKDEAGIPVAYKQAIEKGVKDRFGEIKTKKEVARLNALLAAASFRGRVPDGQTHHAIERVGKDRMEALKASLAGESSVEADQAIEALNKEYDLYEQAIERKKEADLPGFLSQLATAPARALGLNADRTKALWDFLGADTSESLTTKDFQEAYQRSGFWAKTGISLAEFASIAGPLGKASGLLGKAFAKGAARAGVTISADAAARTFGAPLVMGGYSEMQGGSFVKGATLGFLTPQAEKFARSLMANGNPYLQTLFAETVGEMVAQQAAGGEFDLPDILAGMAFGVTRGFGEVRRLKKHNDTLKIEADTIRADEEAARAARLSDEAAEAQRAAARLLPEGERPKVDPSVEIKPDATVAEASPTAPRVDAEPAKVDTSTTPKPVDAEKVEPPRADTPKPVDVAGDKPEVTSIKNRVTDAERAERGVEPMEAPLREAWGEVYDQAKAVLKDNPSRADELVRELSTNPRPHTTEEAAILSLKRVDLHRARTKADEDGIRAAERGDLDAVAEAKARSMAASNEFLALEIATKKGGTETARALAVRRAELAMDYSLSAMEATRRAENDYKPLTPQQAAETKALHDRLAKAIADRDAYHARVVELESSRAKGKPAPSGRLKYGESNRVVTQDTYAKARESLQAKLSQLNVGIDPTVLKDLVTIGAYHLEAGARGFVGWSKAVLKDFSEEERKKITPHLRTIYQEATSQAPPIQGADGKVDVRQAGKIAQLVMEGGVRGREAVIDEVHAILKESNPDITRRQTMDAISGYGRVQKLDKDAIKVELRELKGQMLQIAKLEDMAGGKAPLKTGLERQAPGEVQSDLIRKVNEEKRKGGYVSERKERELRSVLQTTQRRIETQIRDLEKQIEARARKVRDKTPGPTTDTIEALKTKRDSLKAELDKIAPKPGMTTEAKLRAKKKQLQASIESLDRQIRSGEKDVAKAKPPLVDGEVLALTARRDELRAQYNEVFTKPGLTDEQRLAAHKKVMEKRIKEYERRLKEGVMEVPARRPLDKDAEAIRLEAALESAKTEWMAAVVRDRMANRTKSQKALTAAFVETPNLARAAMTSIDVSAVLRQGGFIALGHPVRAFRALGPMFKAFASKAAQDKSEAQIRLRENFGLARRSGLYLADESAASLTKMEEAYMSRWIERRPQVEGQPVRNLARGAANVATAPIRASQRAYNTFLNRLRMDSFDAMLAGLQKSSTPTPAEAKAVANYINTATGRGLSDSNALAALNTVFFSPRLVASRFEIATGLLLARNKGRVRKMIAAEYARFLGGIGTIYTLASLAGADVEEDPRSSDFGKIRFGDTRLDPLTGLAQATTLMARLSTGQTKSTRDGALRDIRGDVGFGRQDAADIIKQFLRSKLAPVAGAMVDAASGTTVVGEEVTPASVAANLTVPMSVRDISEAMQEQGIPRGAAMGILSLFGMGLSTFGKKEKPKKRKKRTYP